jgi:peptidoglycan hydrolase-like protein with peptidoglycan-binding domain
MVVVLVAPAVLAGYRSSEAATARGSSETATVPVTASIPTMPTTEPPATAPPTTVPRVPSTSPPIIPPPVASPPAPRNQLQPGDHGDEVLARQNQLRDLGYWLGSPDGSYGPSTTHAVVALQKANGLARDGVAGPGTRRVLARAQRVQPTSHEGHVIEVDLRRQIVIVADNGFATWVLDTSTGAQAGTTPIGHWKVFREVNGNDTGPNGTLYRPKYFNQRVAFHGYPSVPATPASHGCVRVTNQAMDFLWSSGTPIGTAVWVY